MQTAPGHIYEFGGFRLDPAKRRLQRVDGTPVPLTRRVFDTLLYMIEHHDAVLDKEQIMEAVWPDSIVEENNLAQAISKLRQVFGETPGSHSYIVTVPGRGYRFVAEVNERAEGAVAKPNAARGIAEQTVEESLPEAPDETKPAPGTFLEPTIERHALSSKTAWLWGAVAGISAIAIVSILTLV